MLLHILLVTAVTASFFKDMASLSMYEGDTLTSGKDNKSPLAVPFAVSSGENVTGAPLLPVSKKVTYVDQLALFPTAAQLAVPGYAKNNDYNIVCFSFWLHEVGPKDAAESWTKLDSATRQSYINAFHSVGKRVLISAFGETDAPTTNGADAVDTATRLAAFVKDYGFDGVDVDYEDHRAFANGTAENWIISLTQTLRLLLPSPHYSISHAPQAPMFSSKRDYLPGGGYVAIEKAAGSSIDWYNIQFYNQVVEAYDTCTTLLQKSIEIQGTSLFEIAAKGVPLSKLVIGKPAAPKAAVGKNSGWMESASLAKCVLQAKGLGWNAGVMGWNFEFDPQGQWIAEVGGSLDSTISTATAGPVETVVATIDSSRPRNTYSDPYYGILDLSGSEKLVSVTLLTFIVFLF
ncbi:UNVERIFIED_CONTAM: hypothetical protein HDU68_011294 [Siphonaria sp. JEL0065]|nr:hypothetical protein HDU68_011294 [Siphonaria sp. JEL0065]